MYSVVLMMAMTGTPDMAAFGKKHGGCEGGCAGCYGGCTGYDACGCHGGGGKKARKHRSHGCSGCQGGCYGGSCYGGGYGGCMGASACGCCGVSMGCYGGQMMAPTGTTNPPANVPPPKTGMISGPATIVVSLPADATLKVDGVATKATSAVRTFATPTLDFGQSYSYTLTAEVVRDGKALTAVEQITVRAGQTTQVQLPTTAFGLAVAAK
jgi:uncharacterized protein (TIGR03000 family)